MREPSSPSLPADDAAAEATLITRAQAGEHAAFDALVTLHRHKVYATIYNLIRDEQEAWDLAQDTFLKAWKSLHLFRGQSSFFTWLYRIATNLTIDWLRRKRIEGGTAFDDAVRLEEIEPGSATAPRPVPSPSRALEHREVGRRIDEALALLSPEHRTVLILREIDGESYEAMAEKIGCSVGTVMSRLFYARKKLQAALNDLL